MKVGDFVKINHKYMSPLTAKRYNDNPMGLVIWVSNNHPQVWGKVMLVDGCVLSFPTHVLTRTDSVLDKTSEPDTLPIPYPGGAA